MKSGPLIILVILIQVSVSAQKKATFHSINTIGVAMGQTGNYVVAQSVNGVKYKKWYTGIGIGGDYYQYLTYPLFVDARKYFGKYCKAFAYADVGYNFTGKNTPGKEVSYYTDYSFSGGIYNDIGIGYRSKFSAKSALQFSVGYSYKEMQSSITTKNDCIIGPCSVNYHNYKYACGRVVLKAGVDF
jgi:hypothetical protein